jgi:hypothetical protein
MKPSEVKIKVDSTLIATLIGVAQARKAAVRLGGAQRDTTSKLDLALLHPYAAWAKIMQGDKYLQEAFVLHDQRRSAHYA